MNRTGNQDTPSVRYDIARRRFTRCKANDDGDCEWNGCPQLRDVEPTRSNRHCPLDSEEPSESLIDSVCRGNPAASKARLAMSWASYIALLPENERRPRTEECRRAWGGLPSLVEVYAGRLRPIWGDD